MRTTLLLLCAFGFGLSSLKAQGDESGNNSSDTGPVSGNFQVLWQSYSEDERIGAIVPPEKTGYNAYGNLRYNQGGFSAGFRYESYLNAVLGFPGRFKGSGIGYRFARYASPSQNVDVTIGNFYEQFGSGIVLRSYEERALGIDNALDGVRIILRPLEGLQIKTIYGKQRFDFDDGLINGDGIVRGIDGNLDLNALLAEKGGQDWKTKVNLGANFVSKF